MSIGKIKEFDVANGNWLSYCDRLKMYFTANDIKPELHLPTLISLVGDQTYELIVNLTSPKNVSECKFEDVIKIVGNHLQPTPSVMAERYRFRQRRQLAGENVASYVAELKRLSRHCDFGATLEDNLRDQLVCGITSEVIRQRLFAEQRLTYTRAVTLATALEAAEKDAAAVDGTGNRGQCLAQEGINALYGGPGTARGAEQCAACGGRDHVATGCKFTTYQCSECRVVGHLRRMCPRLRRSGEGPKGNRPTPRNNSATSGRGGGRSGGRGRGRSRGQPTHFVTDDTALLPDNRDDEDHDASSEEEPIYQMSLRDYPAVSILISIDNREIPMEVDTGSACSCISSVTYKKLFKHLPLQTCSVTLRFYDGSIVNPLGFLRANVKHHNVEKILDLYVIEGGTTSLLGRQWLAELSIQLPIFQTNSVSVGQAVAGIRSSDIDSNVCALVDRYSSLFDGALGRYTGGRATLHVRADTVPVYCRARPLPYSLRDQVDAELDNMLKTGIIEPVEFSEWATPLVPVRKPCGKLRVCADFKVTLNPALLVDRYPLPKVEDLFASLSGGEHFTKIDLSSAYNQIELDEASKAYTVINTHRGLFRFNRLVYGLSSSSGIFSRVMTNLMRDIPNVSVFCDDLLVTGKDRQAHMTSLAAVFNVLKVNGLKLNKNKCVFFANSVSYLGHIVDKNGIRTDPEKIRAIQEIPEPSCVSELRSFLGLVNFYGRFVRNLSTLLSPLHNLLKKGTRWEWSRKCKMAFNEVKLLLTSAEILKHYDQNDQLILTCDASSVGIGCILSQPQRSGGGAGRAGGERPVAYASRALTPAERQYSQIQREALAIIFAVKKYHQYLYGRRFLLRTDHKALITIFGPKVGVPSMAASRLQRWAIILSAYDYDIEYVRSEDNGADGLSRLPLPYKKKCNPEQTYLHFARDAFLLDYNVLKRETAKDPILSRIICFARDGWPVENEIRQLQPYFNRKAEIYLELGCLMWGHRVIIPEKCRDRVLKELHETHIGMVKMKSLARSYVWWAGIDEAIESACRACATCAAHAAAPPTHAPRPWPYCIRPWSRLHVDFLGPISGMKFLVVVDSTSKWIEIFNMKSTTASDVISKFRRLFSQFGLPIQIVSDNGPPFTSDAFKLFLNSNHIEQCLTAPYHPSSNGAAEVAVRLCKNVIKKALSDGVDVETALDRFLLIYRTTEHSTTGESPAKVLQGRSLRTRLDAIKPDRSKRVEHKQQSQVLAAGGSYRDFGAGEEVYIRDYSRGRAGNWTPGQVVQRLGSSNYRVRDCVGNESHRHIDQIKRRSRASLVIPISTSNGNDVTTGSVVPSDQVVMADSNVEVSSGMVPSGGSEQARMSTESTMYDCPASGEPSASDERAPRQDLKSSPDLLCQNRPKRDIPSVRRYGFDCD